MPVARFYCPELAENTRELELPEAAAHHAARTLRLAVGDGVALFDGRGGEARGAITAITRRAVLVGNLAWRGRDGDPRLSIVLAQALCAQDKMDWIVQKAVELGVAAIQPLAAERSVARLSAERAHKRAQHWHGVAAAACEQCGRNRLPEIFPPQPLAGWLHALGDTGAGSARLAFLPHAQAPLTQLPTPGARLTLLVGPEGGFTAGELGDAARAGFTPVRLGPRVLRTETAAIAALAAVQTLWGDLR